MNATATEQLHSDEHLVTDVRIGKLNVKGTILRVAIRPGSRREPPLLLLNGIGANLELLKPFVDKLDPAIEAISFDVPGVGGSPMRKVPLRFSGLARLVDDLLEHLGYSQADVLGVSWGGALAQEFAYQYPRRCRRLILAATATGTVMVPGSPLVMMNMASPRRYLQPQHMANIAPKLYGGALRDNPELAAKHVQSVMAGSSLGYLWQMFATLGWTSIHWLHRLRQPTLILAGDDDPLVPLINAKLMARLIPNSRLHVFHCGHLFIITCAEEAAALVHGFVTEA